MCGEVLLFFGDLAVQRRCKQGIHQSLTNSLSYHITAALGVSISLDPETGMLSQIDIFAKAR